MTAPLTAQTVAGPIETAASAAGSPLIANCTESVITAEPLSPRPVLRRATFASKPGLHRHHAKAKAKTKPRPHAAAKHIKRKVVHSAHRPAPKHHAAPRKILRRVTYASPLCAQRTEAINDMLGLPDYAVTEPPVVADTPALADAGQPTTVPTLTGPGTVGPIGPGTNPFPVGPGLPIGPGPITILPPTGPGTPGTPVTPPINPSPAPEPSSWLMMLMGMMLIGSTRRRAARKAVQ